MRTIAVMNQKGGVGKSTTTMNLAHALSMQGHEVVALDMDPQGHLTTGFGVLNEAEAGVDEEAWSEVKKLVDPSLHALLDQLAANGKRLGSSHFHNFSCFLQASRL